MRLWTVPSFGTLLLRMDRLSALFLLITGLVFLPVSIFCAGYLPRYLGRYSLRAFGVMYLALYASIVLILTRRRCPAVPAGLGGHVDPHLFAGEL